MNPAARRGYIFYEDPKKARFLKGLK